MLQFFNNLNTDGNHPLEESRKLKRTVKNGVIKNQFEINSITLNTATKSNFIHSQ